MLLYVFSLNILSCLAIVSSSSNECQFLTMCKCTNFPLFALIDTSYLSKPRSALNQDLFCAHASDASHENQSSTFEQLKYFYYRFRTLTFANYPSLPSNAFRFVHFESQSVKATHRTNNRNVIAFVNAERTQPGIFDELTLTNAHDQLMVSFLDSPSLIYTNGALSKLNCYELKLQNTNPQIRIDFFRQVVFIGRLLIENPSFDGFLPSSDSASSFTPQVHHLSIKDVSVRHLRGKHFPLVFNAVSELTLENHHVHGAFRSFNNRELAQRFPSLRSLTLFSRSIQHLVPRMFEHFTRLEFLRLNGITTIENEAFFHLYDLKELHLGRDIRRLDPYAFIHMQTHVLLLNQSERFQLDDRRHFCVFSQFSPSLQLTTFVQFAKNLLDCSCTLRYLYRHLDKSFLPSTPNCYSNSSLYILTQEERICHFEQRLLQCDVLPDQGITIYGQHYNVSHFYQQQLSKHRNRFSLFFQPRLYYVIAVLVLVLGLLAIIRQQKHRRQRTYRYLNRLIKRGEFARSDSLTTSTTFDIVYRRTNEHLDVIPVATSRSTKV